MNGTKFDLINFYCRIEGITIATDIICGFPTETSKDFDETLKLCEKYKFPSLFINQFYPRPGTVAAKMERVPTKEVKERTRKLTKLFESYAPYEGRENQVYKVLVTEESKDKKYFVGHNQFYEQILIPKDIDIMGQLVTVKIKSVARHYMYGDLIELENVYNKFCTII